VKAGAIYRGDACVVERVWRAANPWTRLRGLLGRRPLRHGEGLLIEPCGSVHTFGMRYALDLVFLDRADRVVDVCAGLAPMRVRASRAKARKTLELPAGSLDRLVPVIGETLAWRAH